MELFVLGCILLLKISNINCFVTNSQSEKLNVEYHVSTEKDSMNDTTTVFDGLRSENEWKVIVNNNHYYGSTSDEHGFDRKLDKLLSLWERSNNAMSIQITNLTTEVQNVLAHLKESPEKVKQQNDTSYRNTTIDTERYPSDCYEVMLQGHVTSGVYTIQPCGSRPLKVYCDQDTDDGGWTVFQNRFDGSVDFYRDWNSYKVGFGNLTSEYWLGLENVHLLTKQKDYKLRVDLQDFLDVKASVMYNDFYIGSESEFYRLNKLGLYHGTAGDSLTAHVGKNFSTWDKDNDKYSKNCAAEYTGAFWYYGCLDSNLNGQYLKGQTSQSGKGMTWKSFHGLDYSLKKSRMMIKPIQQT